MSKKPRYINRVHTEEDQFFIQEPEPEHQPGQEPTRHWEHFLENAFIAAVITTVVCLVSWAIMAANDISLKQTAERIENSVTGNTAQAQFAAYFKQEKVNGYSPDLLESLKRTGLSNSKRYSQYIAVADKPIIDHYRKLTGLQFVSSALLSNIHKTTGLVVAETHRFKGEIPAENIMEMNEGLKKLDQVFGHTADWSGMYWKSEGFNIRKLSTCMVCGKDVEDPAGLTYHSPKENPDLFILAKPTELNLEGSSINSDGWVIDRDPAILYKVPEGYLILTAWE